MIDLRSSSSELPVEWDALAEAYFQTREFLAHCERQNPCRQRYYVMERDGQITAGAVVYSLRLDLFTYRNIHSPIPVSVVGVPCSVGVSGMVGQAEDRRALLGALAREERGFLLVLNLDVAPDVPGILTARTLPTVVLRRRFTSWEEYLACLRSPYRRRLSRIDQAGACLERVERPCSQFSEEMYRQYLAVLARSKGRLETLPREFFRHLPTGFTLTAYRQGAREVGWRICREDGPPAATRLTFFLGGVDEGANRDIPLYFALLLDVLKSGIEAGVTTIDFGQTAEVPKLRLGGELAERYLLMTHSKVALRLMLRALRPLLAYRRRVPMPHVYAMMDQTRDSVGSSVQTAKPEIG